MSEKYTFWGLGNVFRAAVRFHRSRSVQAAILLYVLLPMCVLISMGAWWGLRMVERVVESQMQRDLEMVAQAIKRPLSHALLREREGSIAEALKAAFELNEVYGAYLYDADGRRISETERGKGAVERAAATELAAAGKSQGEYSDTGDRELYSHFMPISDASGRITALLQLTRRRSDFVENIDRLRVRAVGFTFLGFCLLSGMVMSGNYVAFGKQLKQLSDSMNRISQGHRTHRHRPEGSRELVELGRHFNRMLDNIDAAESEIRARRESERELEERLRHSEKLAAIGELAAGVAHELGTPLSLIDARLQQLMRRPDSLGEREAKVYASIRTETDRMQHIIRQLLHFSRRHEFCGREVEVARLLEDTGAAVLREAEKLDVTLTVEEVPEGVKVHGDADRLRQALVNLIRNAVQAAQGGTVRLRARRDGNAVVVEVEDNGPGIPPGAANKIFEPFFTTKAVGEGTGLGLAVVHGIVTEHGGEVWCDSGEGKGTCFRLRLPADAPAEEMKKGGAV